MKILMPVLCCLTAFALADIDFAPGLYGGTIQWTPIDGEYTEVVLIASNTEYDLADESAGVVVAVFEPDSSSGIFRSSYQLPAVFIVDPDGCISCQICVPACPVAAITMDEDNKAVIDPNLCIACGICASACPVQTIFAFTDTTYYVLVGVNEDGTREVIEEYQP